MPTLPAVLSLLQRENLLASTLGRSSASDATDSNTSVSWSNSKVSDSSTYPTPKDSENIQGVTSNTCSSLDTSESVASQSWNPTSAPQQASYSSSHDQDNVPGSSVCTSESSACNPAASNWNPSGELDISVFPLQDCDNLAASSSDRYMSSGTQENVTQSWSGSAGTSVPTVHSSQNLENLPGVASSTCQSADTVDSGASHSTSDTE